MFLHRTLATLLIFYRSIPIPFLIIHYIIMVIIGTCGSFDMKGFWTYFTCMIILSCCFGFYMGLTLWRKKASKQMLYAFYNSILSGLNFTAWVLIRPTPLSCFDVSAYEEIAPIIFGIVNLITLASSFFFILGYNNLEIKAFVRWKIPDFQESSPYNDLFEN